jgi:Lrp/AsnC family transcriptional regulator, leucine-responsive regulatory protein
MSDDLDELDLKILDILAQEGRISWGELASRIGRAPTPTIRRVRALEKAGYITGYHAKIDEERIGRGISVFVSVRLETQREGVLAAFETQIAKAPEVMSCFMMAGDADYLLRVVVPDLAACQMFLAKTLARMPGVARLTSSFALKSIVQRFVPPLRAPSQAGRGSAERRRP